ncbi:MAG: hypothetical protein J7K40_10240 [candidate division Zixibacteria bacterium]|nr:hypothetical protein [candidate division Zixibacteria bacterium]
MNFIWYKARIFRRISVDKIKSIKPDSKVIGLWINDKWTVEKIVEK